MGSLKSLKGRTYFFPHRLTLAEIGGSPSGTHGYCKETLRNLFPEILQKYMEKKASTS